MYKYNLITTIFINIDKYRFRYPNKLIIIIESANIVLRMSEQF